MLKAKTFSVFVDYNLFLIKRVLQKLLFNA